MKKYIPYYLVLFFIWSFIIYAFFSPDTQEKIKNILVGDQREVLATLQADLTGKNNWYTIVKVKTSEDISLEFYTLNKETNENTFSRRIVLDEKIDGNFTFRGNSVSLSVDDVDEDQTLEILTAAYDHNLIPRLSVFKFDPNLLIFNKMSVDSF